MTEPLPANVKHEPLTTSALLSEVRTAIDHLLMRFWLERFCYLLCALVAVGLLAWSVSQSINSGGVQNQQGALFSSTGLFAATSLGVLYTFRQAYKLVVLVIEAGLGR